MTGTDHTLQLTGFAGSVYHVTGSSAIVSKSPDLRKLEEETVTAEDKTDVCIFLW